jgi:pimeloyl-ACP methyl ester carboxylesterase
VRYADWGERSARWAGIRSEMVKARDTTVHLLRADADSGSSRHLPTHLLIHPMASGATFWLDVIRPLSVYGSVIAPDLPGAVLGQTRVPNRYASQAGPSAKFVRALTATLGLNHVVVHGWSFGGLVALLFANLHPVHVQRLILTNPTLPGPLTPTQHAGWQTVGRLAFSWAHQSHAYCSLRWGRRWSA